LVGTKVHLVRGSSSIMGSL